MSEYPILWEWLSFAVRWLHVVTAVAWIGSSFYFIALDLGLVKRPHLPEGVYGEEWQVHGGGFYHIQKYLVAPANMPEHLIWFKWESYFTWMSGAALLAVVYYGGADLFLIDTDVMELAAWQSILISMVSLTIGWICYDLLCKSPLGKNTWGLMILLYIVLIAMAYAYTQVFSGRATFLHLGAFTATIMTANVFFIIIPNQKIVVADLKAGRTPDPKLGAQAKQRSLHNNYLTLPVIFFMLSNHYPMAFATAYNWIIAALVFLLGVTIRHWFNTTHARKGHPWWTWVATVVIFCLMIWLSTLGNGAPKEDAEEGADAGPVAPAYAQFVADPHFEGVRDLVQSRCAMCHAKEPVWDGIVHPPKAVKLETDNEIAQHARQIYLQAGISKAMPPGNVTYLTAEDRDLLTAWYESATSGKATQ